MVKNWVLKWLKKHPRVAGAIFSLGFYLMEYIDLMGCADCSTKGP
jgi:hypothetical protein